jgi:hypothetical protein
MNQFSLGPEYPDGAIMNCTKIRGDICNFVFIEGGDNLSPVTATQEMKHLQQNQLAYIPKVNIK